LNTVPLKVVSTWNQNTKSVAFFMGKHTKVFVIDLDISKYDYVHLIQSWLKRFYPKYEVALPRERSYTSEEINQIREDCLKSGEKFELANYLNKKKIENFIEKGIIQKVFILQDQFIIQRNEQKYLCAPGSFNIPMSIGPFMNDLRKITLKKVQDKEIHAYILGNSYIVEKINDAKIDIVYSDKKMLNFFKIRFSDLRNYSLEKVDSMTYHWSKFKIVFDSEYTRDSCLEYYRERKKLI
jgi:hypothetical protein